MNAVVDQLPDTEELRASLQLTPEVRREISDTGALALAKTYEVDCAPVAQDLANQRVIWAKKIDRIKTMQTESQAPAKKMMEDMKAWGLKWFGPALADLEAARDLARQKLLGWDQSEKMRIAKEQAERDALARKLRQEAESRAAAERAKAEEQAKEARRKAEEAAAAQRKAEAEGNARAAQAAAAARAKAEEQARAALETGEAKAQQVTLEAAAQVQGAPVAEPVKIVGQSVRSNWVAELLPNTDEEQAKALIVKEAAVRPELLGLLKLDVTAVNRMAKALKGSMRVPGYTAVNRPQLAGSRK